MDKTGNNLVSNPFKIKTISSSGISRFFPPLSPSIVMVGPRPGSDNGLDPALPASLVSALRKQVNIHKITGVRLGCILTPSQVLSLSDEVRKIPYSMSLAVKVRLSGTEHPQVKAPAVPSGIKLVEWIQPDGPIELLTQIMRAYSKAGIWNHVVIPIKSSTTLNESLITFAVGNPNIVHSWQVAGNTVRSFPVSGKKTESGADDSSGVSPLPGQPFWRVLADLDYLLLFLDKYGLKEVIRWRVLDPDQDIITLGKNLFYHFVAPRMISQNRLDEICQLVEAGGSVKTQWVRYNLERAFLIAYVTEMDVVVANSSLKHPRPEYITALSEQTDLDLSTYLERGYTSVRPEYRGMGIGTRLLAGLTSRAGDRMIFSLISENNRATQKIALKNHTRKVTTFFSQRTNKQMGVWIPESMIDRM